MNIFHICINFSAVHSGLIEAEREAGHVVSGLHYTLQRNQLCSEVPNYIQTFVSPGIIRGPLCFHHRLKIVHKHVLDKLSKSNFDIIHAHRLFTDGDIAYELSKAIGVPFVITVRNTDINQWFTWWLPWNRSRGIEIVQHASKIVFLCPEYLKHLLSRLPKRLHKCILEKSVIIPNGIDMFWHQNAFKGVKETISNGKVRLITVGRIEGNKNQIIMLKVLPLLRARGWDVKYTVIGDAMDQKIFKKLLNCNDVKIVPFQTKEELTKYYRNADIYVMPSITESFGLTYVEAMSQGLPVIYTRNQGFDGQFQEGEVGFSVSPTDPYEICDAIINILEQYPKFSYRAQSGSLSYTWKAVAQQMDMCYQNARERN